MKKLVVFYSLEGNTRLVANTIARAAGADVLELAPEKELSAKGFTRYLWGGKSVLMREKPALKPLALDPSQYDMFFLGTPVWAWSMAPPLATFLSRFSFTGKPVALFCCHGGGPGKVLRKMREAIPGGVFLGELDLQEPRTNDTEPQLEKVRKWVGTILSKLE
jgi:flavodoxin